MFFLLIVPLGDEETCRQAGKSSRSGEDLSVILCDGRFKESRVTEKSRTSLDPSNPRTLGP